MRRTEAERLASLHEALRSGLALEIVKAAGLSFAAVAEFVGCTTPTSWRILTGETPKPRRAHALRLAKLLETLQARR